MTSIKRIAGAASIGALVTGLGLSVLPASAAYVVTLRQEADGVVATGSGSLDLSGLTSEGEYSSGPAALWPAAGYINTGPTSSVALDAYTGFLGPTSFGSGGFTGASSGSGDSVEIWGSSAQYGVPLLWVPHGYVSGTALSDTSTYDGATFAGLGVSPGTYTWSWEPKQPGLQEGWNQLKNVAQPLSPLDDTFILRVAVPEPSTWVMMLAGFALLGCAGYRARRSAVAALL